MEDYKQLNEKENDLKNIILSLQSEKDRQIGMQLFEIYKTVDRDRIFNDKTILENLDNLKFTVEHENTVNDKDLISFIDMVFAPETNTEAAKQITEIEQKLRNGIIKKDSTFFITLDGIAKSTQRHPVMEKVGAANALHLASSAISRNSAMISNLIDYIYNPSIENRQLLFNETNKVLIEKITALNNAANGLNNSYVTLATYAKTICALCEKYDAAIFKATISYIDFKVQRQEIERQKINDKPSDLDKIEDIE